MLTLFNRQPLRRVVMQVVAQLALLMWPLMHIGLGCLILMIYSDAKTAVEGERSGVEIKMLTAVPPHYPQNDATQCSPNPLLLHKANGD